MRFDGTKLRALRKAKGMTVRQLAQATSRHEQQIGSYELGRAVPGVNIAQMLANALGCIIDDFMSDTTPGEPDTA